MRASWVYFIRPVGQDGPVKIGWSRLPEDRLRALMVRSPFPLEIVARIEGDLRTEGGFHALFRDQHSHGEWFHASDELTNVIGQIAAGEFSCDGLPAPRRLYIVKWTPQARRAASVFRRLDARKDAPPHIIEAAGQYRRGRLHRDYDPAQAGNPANLDLIEAFLDTPAKPSSPSKQEAA